MRVLLDECLPRRVNQHLSPHSVVTVPEAGWAGLQNGVLLAKADGAYDAFVTIDSSLTFQQNIARFKLRLIVVHARSNKLADLIPLAPGILAALETCKSGETIHVQ